MLVNKRCQNQMLLLIMGASFASALAWGGQGTKGSNFRKQSASHLSCMSAAIQKLISKQFLHAKGSASREIVHAELKKTTPNSRSYTIKIHVTQDNGIEKDEYANVEVAVSGKRGGVLTCR